MWDMRPRVPVNIKRRSVSAVRDFPKGCGPKFVPKPNPPVELESKPKVAEANGDAASVESSSFKVPRDPIPVDSEVPRAENGVKLESLEVAKGKEVPSASMVGVEEVNINGHVEECVNGDVKEGESSSMKCVNREEIVSAVEVEGVKINGHVEECVNEHVEVEVEVLGSKKCGNGDVEGEKPFKWKGFPVLKRRKVSAVRDFPVGCGRGASKIRNVANSEVGPVASSESKVFYGGKKVVDGEVRMNGGNTKGSAVGGSVKMAVVEVTNGEAIVKSPKVKTLDREKNKNPAGVGISPSKKLVAEVKKNESPIKSPKAKSSGEEKKPLAKEKEVMEGSDSVSSAEMAEAGSNRTQVSIDVKSSERISEEKKPATKRGAAVDGSMRVSSAEVVETEAKKHVSSKVRVKSSLKSSSRESTVKDHSEKKMLAQHSSKKELEGQDVKQVSKSLHVKESRDAKPPSGFKIGDKDGGRFTVRDRSEKKMLAQYSSKKELKGQDVKQVSKSLQVKESRDAKPPSGFKIGDKEGGSLEGKTVDKGCVDTPKDGKNLKRKFPEEEGDESLEAFADREMVHALVAAEKCPWRSGRNSGGRIPRSTTPKVKAKRVKKLLGGNSASASRRASASLHENIVDVEDEEDSRAQDGGNEMAIALYDGSHELCITMTPAVPPGQVSSSEEAISRNMVKKTLRMFQLICRKLVRGEEKKSKGRLEANSKENSKNRVDLKAASMLKDSKLWVNHGEPIIGHVPGVEVGDEFHFRVELSIIGLHRPFQAGIDYAKGLATSIVASGGYPDDIDSSDVLIYSGSGGNAASGGNKQAVDQKLERGNLALKNSMDAQSPVRVVYGFKELVKSDPRNPKPKKVATFTYDGLYIVEKYWPERGNNGFNVFKFQLRRMPGQPETALKEVKKTKKSKVREGLCVKDISDGKEPIPICAVNTVDGDQPLPFHYITRVIYPSWYVQKPPRGCDCTDGCSDSEKCACAVKNGGEIPFNYNGAIVQAKPLVYECGPSCKCPPTCHNRVSQHGIRLPLEIFKTSKRGWGVRSLYSIPSGTFVCEYVGEMLDEADAEQRSNDEYLFDIGHNYDDHTLWEGLSSSIPGLQSDAVSEAASESTNDVSFTIDAAKYGNVGRFINHNCSPNLYAQNLLYDHDDKKMPHVMFFAIDNIPPLQELTYHYNYTIDQVRDSAGNIKKKECLCGSPECTGRLY